MNFKRPPFSSALIHAVFLVVFPVTKCITPHQIAQEQRPSCVGLAA